MKCPKCGYLGYETGDCCRNCNYDFSLIGRQEPASPAPVRDPSLTRGSRYRKTPSGSPTPGVDRPLMRSPEGTPVDLPLFDDGPLPPPRPPLSVRRQTPTPARLRIRSDVPKAIALELNLEPPAQPPRARPQAVAGPTPMPARPEPVSAHREAPAQPPPAAPGRRFAAALIDVLLMAGVDAVLLAFTLRLCGLTPAGIGALPVIPMTAFLVVFDSAYIVLFTGTMGQTFGKMAVGIEVVSGLDRVDLTHALLRTLAMALSVLPAGLGFVPAAFGDFRALHDRLTGTRVVRIPAVS